MTLYCVKQNLALRLRSGEKALTINKYHGMQVSAYRIQEQKIDTP